MRSSNQSRNLATRQPNNLQKEIRWIRNEKYGGNPSAGGAEAEKDIARLKKGEHVDYVIGWVDFAGCRIDLSPSLAGSRPRLAWSKRPLIPRPETEFWVEKAIEDIQRSHYAFSSRFTPSAAWGPTRLGRKHSARASSVRILDLFAGSGCVGVAVLKHIPLAKVDFVEKERGLLEQIKINAKLNGIASKRYRVFQSDVFSNIKGKYDCILANPPYVAETRKAKVQKSVLEQEPHSAVFGGKDGLYYIRKFLKEAKGHLKPNGKIYMEFDSFQKQAIANLLKQFGYTRLEFFKDQYAKWRYARIVF